MNENAKKLVWVLKSGKYKQGKGKLRNEGGGENGEDLFCCLGVGCDLYRKITGKGEWQTGGFSIDGKVVPATFYMPREVSDFYGFASTTAGYLVSGCSSKALAHDNDDGSTFEEIATRMESEPSGLFKPEFAAV